MNNKKFFFNLSNYSLTNQIVIINISTAFLGLLFLIVFNVYLLINNQNIENQKKFIEDKLNNITGYLVKNAIIRPYPFDDSCSGIIREQDSRFGGNIEFTVSGKFLEKKINCKIEKDINKRIQNNPLELDPTFTQKYIYSNFADYNIIIRVFDDNLNKYADTDNIFPIKEEIIISDIADSNSDEIIESFSFYNFYKNNYFNFYNSINKNLIINKLN